MELSLCNNCVTKLLFKFEVLKFECRSKFNRKYYKHFSF